MLNKAKQLLFSIYSSYITVMIVICHGCIIINTPSVRVFGLICELWLTCHWIALDDSDIQIIKTYASLGVVLPQLELVILRNLL